MILVTFAVVEESRAFEKQGRVIPHCRVLLTGMGSINAERSLAHALGHSAPRLVISSGFAGGLNPSLATGQVVCDLDPGLKLDERVLATSATSGRFINTDRVVTSAREKAQLWEKTGADAVEMESAVIRTVCRDRGIPSATIRVISDSAGEDLPLNFNQLMRPDMTLSYPALVAAILRSPGRIPHLLRFQRQVRSAAQNLARVLILTLKGLPQ
jgi:nucleoside phosphorylase